jgi:hypothetical protein
MTKLISAKEGNTYIINYTFYDESSVSMIPSEVKWSLRNNNGVIVNNRSNVSVLTPATNGTIILTPSDLVYEKNSSSERVFTIQGIYNGTYGSACTCTDEVGFSIEDIIGI